MRGRVDTLRADMFELRFHRLKLNQQRFAARFGLTFGMVKDVEQGRHAPHRAFKVLLAAIELDPSLVEQAAKIAEEKW